MGATPFGAELFREIMTRIILPGEYSTKWRNLYWCTWIGKWAHCPWFSIVWKNKDGKLAKFSFDTWWLFVVNEDTERTFRGLEHYRFFLSLWRFLKSLHQLFLRVCGKLSRFNKYFSLRAHINPLLPLHCLNSKLCFIQFLFLH